MTRIADATSAAERVEQMLAEFGDDPVARDRAEELVRTLVEFYDGGLGRLVELVEERPDGEDVMRQLAADKIVAGLLVLHDLHPDSTFERVSAALERVRPYLGSHSGDVDLLGVDDDNVVHLRLAGSCNGCPSSAVTVKVAIEHAIEEAAPEVVRVEVDGVAAPPLFRDAGGRTVLPMLGAPQPAAPKATWISLDTLADVAPGTLAAAAVGGARTVLANIDGNLYAYHDRCPGCAGALHTGELVGEMLRCDGCAQHFDLRRAGAGRDRTDLHLEPLPLLAEDGAIRVAVPAGALR
jgi:Fe-S cluster biogenesis protein NfuA/nitrite reductase/ring-hydroxylating ferredoxin subunit